MCETLPPESWSTVYYTSYMHLVLNLPLDGIFVDHFFSVPARRVLEFYCPFEKLNIISTLELAVLAQMVACLPLVQ